MHSIEVQSLINACIHNLLKILVHVKLKFGYRSVLFVTLRVEGVLYGYGNRISILYSFLHMK